MESIQFTYNYDPASEDAMGRKGVTENKVAFHLHSQDNHEEDEGYHEDESEEEHKQHKDDRANQNDKQNPQNLSVVQHSNIFYIANSPEPASTSKQETKILNTTNEAAAPQPRDSNMRRQGSLFSNFGFSSQDNNNSHNESNKEEDTDDGYSSTDISEDEEEPIEEMDEEDEDEEEEEEHIAKTIAPKEDNDSEWLSVSSESNNSDELHHPPVPPPLNFHKVDPVPIAVQGKRTTTPILAKPRSLLSGLFLNEMARTHSVPPDKPNLERAQTTGIFTIESNIEHKPSIVFSNKFPSSSDLNTTSEEGTPAPIVKQETIVGVSDINVTFDSNDRQEEDHEKLSSSLNKISRSLSQQSFRTLLSRSQLNLTKMKLKPKQPKQPTQTKPTQAPTHTQTQVQGQTQTQTQTQTQAQGQKQTQTQTHHPQPQQASPPLPMVPPRPVTTTTIELKSNEKILDESLSASLKQALTLDYKLGKVPLPDRVIDDRAISAGNGSGGNGTSENEFDDYYSKGW
ncbi:hypothetical protein JA1_004798 [Spathaspora sp. JA1]|nr:hypothetical protein JA1_004798 [Spathaspora sp. JA1]